MSDQMTDKATYVHDIEADVDEFERRDFASRVAKTVLDQPLSRSSLVVSIVGPWGSGKSTVLKYVKDELAQKPCKIAQFNPWRYAGEDALLFHLFEELVKAIDPNLSVLTKWQEMRRAASTWSRALKMGTQFAGAAAHLAAPGSGVLVSGALASILPEEFKARLEDIREQARSHLNNTSMRVVVSIDDVDRLEPDETLLLFKSIKLIADLPNTTFLIAMDEDHVSQVIGARIDGSHLTGRKYIEKIVNVRLNLPHIPTHIFEDYTLSRLAKVWIRFQGDVPPDEGRRVRGIFRRLHSPYITTPRSVKSIENAYAFALGLLPDEVNAGDVLLLEATRLLHPDLYKILPSIIPGVSLVGSDFLDLMPGRDERFREKKEGLMRLLLEPFDKVRADQKEKLKECLTEWFPQLGYFAPSEDAIEWSRSKRICSMNYFWRYFSGAVHKDDVHDSRVDEWLSLSMQDDKMAVEQLKEHFAKPYARTFIKKLRDLCLPGTGSYLQTILSLIKASDSFQDRAANPLIGSLDDETVEIAAEHIRGEVDYDKRMDLAVALLNSGRDIRWAFKLSNCLPNEYLLKDSSKKQTSENFRESKFDRELALKSLDLYEKRYTPDSNDLLTEMIWSIYRNPDIPKLKQRISKVIKETPRVGLHFLLGGCVFGSSIAHKRACWRWKGRSGLDDVEKLIPLSTLERALKRALPKNQPSSIAGRDDAEYMSLEEVGWACVNTIRELQSKLPQ